ncbi:hypothetical protein BS17DRAFT_818008 [Gyrodon lividus]|nr:hypothetical protein BS17DRAFT_818008 [Gyrodon lividus]
MAEGLEVVIKYKDAKYQKVASTTLSHNAEIAILKKDLARLRVHSPSQKNVRRVDGSFVLHWPTAGTSPRSEEVNVPDTLYTRWIKLCENDTESLKLREILSIGVAIAATSKLEDVHRNVPQNSLAARLRDPLPEEPEQASTETSANRSPVGKRTSAPSQKTSEWHPRTLS